MQGNKKNKEAQEPTGVLPEREKEKTGIKEGGLVLVNVCT